MTLGLFQAGDLKGLTHPFIILRASQEPQERQDSYLALSALRPEHLLVQGPGPPLRGVLWNPWAL